MTETQTVDLAAWLTAIWGVAYLFLGAGAACLIAWLVNA